MLIWGQVAEYKAAGFTNRWWERAPYNTSFDFWPHGLVQRPSKGMFITCFVAYDQRNPNTARFLEEWRYQLQRWSTQDQISFPYVFYKLQLLPHALPWLGFPKVRTNEFFSRVPHGSKKKRKL